MANEYSVEIHQYISAQIAEAENRMENADGDDDHTSKYYYKGRLHELLKIREYMAEHVDLKTQKYY